MRFIRFLLVMAGTSAVALAQTNTSTKTRELSLQDCIEMTLKENLDIQIERKDASIFLYDLRGAYGAYDPTFTASYERDHNEAGSRILSGGFSIPGSISDADIFSGGLSGILPWGLNYSLQTSFNDSYGHTPTFVTTTTLNPTNPYTRVPTYNITNNQAVAYLVRTNYLETLANVPFENTYGSASIKMTQPLLKNFWIDQPRLTIRQAKNTLRRNEQQLRLQIMQTVSKLEQAYFDLIYDKENVAVQEKALEAAERLVAENQKKVEVGTLAPLDLLSAQSQAESSRAALIAARGTLAIQQATIKQFVTGRYSEWGETVLEPSGILAAPIQFFNLQDSWSKGLTQRQSALPG